MGGSGGSQVRQPDGSGGGLVEGGTALCCCSSFCFAGVPHPGRSRDSWTVCRQPLRLWTPRPPTARSAYQPTPSQASTAFDKLSTASPAGCRPPALRLTHRRSTNRRLLLFGRRRAISAPCRASWLGSQWRAPPRASMHPSAMCASRCGAAVGRACARSEATC